MIFLNACGMAHSNATTALILPTVVEYSQKTLNSVAHEAESNYCNASSRLLIDYGIMRDQTREAL